MRVLANKPFQYLNENKDSHYILYGILQREKDLAVKPKNLGDITNLMELRTNLCGQKVLVFRATSV